MPRGTVTLLFSDIQESTRMWERSPEVMASALERHDDLLRDAIESCDGYVFKTKGDGFCATFARPVDALRAAATAQRAIDAEPWSDETPMRVRMAIHSGACLERDGDYFGPPVNRVARLEAVAHGGQVVVSGTTCELLGDELPEGLELRALGEHQLKDLQRPELVFQLEMDGVVRPEFPPLRSLSNPQLRHNLPLQLTSFVGRSDEIAAAKRMLEEGARLLTLTGPGGCGKTRLALQVGADLVDGEGDGVWFVDLSCVQDERFVAAELASVLGVSEEPEREVADSVADAIGTRAMLVLLDNCEHQVGASAKLVDGLLRRCPNLRILATSREPLGIDGEQRFSVPSLEVPATGTGPVRASDVAELESVQLLVQRAKLHEASFEVTDANAKAVASICRRLDGIPLAIELVAARLSMMPPDEVERRLDDRFRLLKGGARGGVPRQQTLEASIAWSYDLLNEPERAVLASCSVFVGPFDLRAAEAVCEDDDVDVYDVMDLIGSLVDRSLLRREPGEGRRFGLGESIRDYAARRLAELGEDRVRDARDRHAAHYGALAEDLDLPPASTLAAKSFADEAATLEQVYAAGFNVLAALRHLASTGGDADRLLRLAYCDAEQCWHERQFAEGVDALEVALASASDATLALRARARLELGMFFIMQGRLGAAQVALLAAREDAIDAGRDDLVLRVDLERAFIGARLGDDSDLGAIADAWSLASSTGNPDHVAFARYLRGSMSDPAAEPSGVDDLREAAAHFRAKGLERLHWDAVAALALAELETGDPAQAKAHFEEVLASDAGADAAFTDTTHLNLAEACIQLGDTASAIEHWHAGAQPIADGKKVAYYVSALLIAAICCTASGALEDAALLHGATARLASSLEERFEPLEAGLRERDLATLREALGDPTFEAALADGARMDFDAAMSRATATLAR